MMRNAVISYIPITHRFDMVCDMLLIFQIEEAFDLPNFPGTKVKVETVLVFYVMESLLY